MEIMLDVAIRFMDHVGIPMEIGFLIVGVLASLIPGLSGKTAKFITSVCLLLAAGTYAYNIVVHPGPKTQTEIVEPSSKRVPTEAVMPAVDTTKANEEASRLARDYSLMSQEKSRLVQENAGLVREVSRLEKEVSRLKTGLENSSEVLGYFFYSGENLEEYYMNAHKILKAKADSGYSEAQFYLGYILDPKHSSLKKLCGKLPQSTKEAKRYYKMAADNGQVMAFSFLGNIYYDEKDYTNAANCYKEVADKGDTEAQYTLGYMYGRGLVSAVIDTSHYTEKFREGFRQGVDGK